MGILWNIYRDSREDRERKKENSRLFDRKGRSQDEQLMIRAKYREQRKKYTDAGLMMSRG